MGDHYHVVKNLLAWGWGYLLMKKRAIAQYIIGTKLAVIPTRALLN